MADTLTVSVTTDYSATALDDIGTIDFVNPAVPATATFANTQFDGSDILNNVQLDGSNGINNIVVNGGAIDASLWTFALASWSPFDTITLNSGASGDAITGSSESDTITGGLGADTLMGRGGDDIIVYNAVAELVAGETIAGGLGTGDILRIAGAGSYDFRIIAAPGGIERLEFDASGGSTTRFNSSQFGGAEISNTVAITGDSNSNLIAVHTLSDAFFSAAGWTFTNWSANDDILIFGTSAAETIIGSSSQQNTIDAGGGADSLTGGGLDDAFLFFSSELIAGVAVNGLGGTDVVTLSGTSASFDLTGVTLTSIERLILGGTATLKGEQIGSVRSRRLTLDSTSVCRP